jgi:nitrate/nitrite transporter NarK
VLNCALIYGSFFAFTSNANAFISESFGISPTTSGQYLSAIFLISALVTPFFGIVVDKYGKTGYFMLGSLVLFLFAHILFVSLPTNAGALVLVPLVMMGIFYSTYAAVFWPCVPLVVEKRVIGTAYGVVIYVNLGEFCVEYFSGVLPVDLRVYLRLD